MTDGPGRHRVARWVLGAVPASLVLALIGVMAGSAAAVADDAGGVDLSVEVAGTGSGSGSSTGTGGSTISGGSGDTPAAQPADEPVDDPSDGVVSGLFVSGADTGYGWSLDPFGGTVTVAFTVRNATEARIASAVRFTLDGPFGNRLDLVDGRPLDLAPGESRVVRATLDGVAQWTYLHATVRLTPEAPAEAGESAAAEEPGRIAPISRDRYLFVPPWAVLGAAAIVAGGVVLLRRLQPFRGLGRPAGVAT